MALCEALDRLAGTRITTNIRMKNEEQYDGFGLIDAHSVRRKHGLDGRLLWCEVKLSDWVFNAIRANEVLTLHPDYFRLRKPLERRVYELARKHCGQQPQWTVSLETLLKKSGSQSPMKRFRQMIRGLAEGNHLPDYQVSLGEQGTVIFTNRMTLMPAKEAPTGSSGEFPVLEPDTYHKARLAAPRLDVHWLELEWQRWWCESGKPALQNPDRAFVAFCKRRGASKIGAF